MFRKKSKLTYFFVIFFSIEFVLSSFLPFIEFDFVKEVHAATTNVLPSVKHANDDTGELIGEITTNNSTCNPDTQSGVSAGDGCFTVDKSNVMQIDTFDVSSIPTDATITGIDLYLEYGAENGYNGSNPIRYNNGGGLTTTGITPTDISGWSPAQTFDLFANGVNTVAEIQNLDIEFINNDGGKANAIHFDYIWITVTYVTFEQSSYRFFANTDTTDVGSGLATEDNPASLSITGEAFRLRMLLHIAGDSLSSSGETFKLQFAQRSGTCDTSFTGETYSDVTGASTIAFYNNTPSDGASLTYNTGDPTHASDNVIEQTYEEANNFTNSVNAISAGEDGEWDFALYDNGASSNTSFCFRVVKSTGTVLDTYTVIPEITTATAPDVTVGTVGSQTTGMLIPSTNQYVGGAFSIKDNTGSRNVTSIKITETGTVDAQNDLDNIKLYYETDTAFPYDCADENYGGSELPFGSTDTDGFSSANGTSTFSGTSVGISTTETMCVYVVLDVGSGATNLEDLDIQITDPSTDVVTSSGTIIPLTPIAISGSTELQESILTQYHYHWRNDNESEALATSVTGGVEDTPLTLSQETPKRLRVEVSNEGATTSASVQYRLEYGLLETSCSDIVSWTDVGATDDDWNMFNSDNITDGNNTTDIGAAFGGVTNENSNHESPNAAVKDTSSQTAGITLSELDFVEIEYSIVASTTASEGNSYCFRVSNAGTDLDSYVASSYGQATIAADVTVGTVGTQTVNMGIPSTNQYVGGAFSIKDNTGSRNVTSIKITETGTVDAQNDLDNIKLYYETDTAFPYDCADENYGGSELPFGSTDTDGFSSANGTSTFSGTSVGISTTETMCVYVVLDVGSGASPSETLDIQIFDSSTDVITSAGSVAPTAPVEISGSTNLLGATLVQTHYHWRNDDNSEALATSATGGTEDTPLGGVFKNNNVRLRMDVSNEGVGQNETDFLLEYAPKITTCSAIATWYDVGAVGGHWDMADSFNLTDGSDTTDIAESLGGLTNENSFLISPNSAVKDTSSQVDPITLTSSQFIEMEFSIEATDSAVFGDDYCFRVSDAGTDLDTYNGYAEATLRDQKDFFVQRGSATLSGTTAVITAGVEYTAPSASTSAFIRITNTNHTGAGVASGGGNQNADDVTVYITDASNLETSVTFGRFGASGDTYVDWEIVEYIGPPGGDNEIIVRAQEPVTFGSGSNYASSTVSGVVTDGDVVVFVTGQANPNTGRSSYNTGLVTSSWFPSTTEAVFERGESGDSIAVSFATVEFTGSNWNIQRKEHVYTQAATSEADTIAQVNTDRAFLHTQKRAGTGENGVDEFGQEVWLSGATQLTFQIESTVSAPGSHTAVVWVIENTQTTGIPMVVTRSNSTQTGGAESSTANVNINKTLTDTTIASIFSNGRGDGANTFFPRAMMGVQIISTTQYQLWISDTGNTQTYRTEVVEWPTAIRTLSQNYYRFYVDNDEIDPTDPWPVGASNLGENTSITGSNSPPATGDVFRIRMSILVQGANLSASSSAFKLQFGERISTCSAISSWGDLGDTASTTALWRGYNATPADGTALSGNPATPGHLNLSVAQNDRAGTYEEENITAPNPYKVFIGEDVEYDWVVQNNLADDLTVYCFRMVYSDGTEFDLYNFYPTSITAGYEVESLNWRWYDDETNETPVNDLGLENIAPSNVANGNTIKLRMTIREYSGKNGENVKFKLQFSESSTFSSGVVDVEENGTCVSADLWCYGDGIDTDNDGISTKLLSDADACSGGSGAGCGQHNESGDSSSTFTFPLNSSVEFEFTIRHAGARANKTYFFRAYDLSTNTAVPLGSGENYPSLSTEGASLSFSISGLPASTVTESIITDVETTSNEISFGELPLDTEIEAAQRLNISTNSTGGYKIFVFERQGFLHSGGGSQIDPVTGTNPSPSDWSTGCIVTASGCYGYHTGDDYLDGASTRFFADDTYAQFDSTSQEVAYSADPVPGGESIDVVYKTQIKSDQEAGSYDSSVVYIAVAVF